MAMHNIPMTAEQLEELMSAAVQMQCDSEKAGEREVSIFAYAVQVAVSEIRKAREELTAAHSTLEKAREVTNCPLGVDLQDHLKQLVAENVAMKEYIKDDCWIYDTDAEQYRDAVDYVAPTPATDSILREAEARGVEKLANAYDRRAKESTHYMLINHCKIKAEQAREFAQQLREGKAE